MQLVPLSTTILLSLLLSLTACRSKKEIVQIAPDEVKYSLKKSACFGKCPVYELNIYEGGRATLNSTKYMTNLGLSEKQLSESTYAELEAAFASSDFHSYPDTIPSLIPDLPSVWVTYFDGTTKKIVYGKEGRPEAVVELEKMMNAIAMSDGWTTIKPVSKPKVHDSNQGVIESQLIMQPIEDKEITDNWLRRYKQHNLKLIKRLSPDLNYYLLEYDTTTIEPASMLELIQDDPAVKLVQFNKAVTMREKSR